MYYNAKNIGKGGDNLKIKEIRESKNMTQEELAEKLDIRRTTISMWETGESLPRTATLIKLAEVLDCSVGELLEA